MVPEAARGARFRSSIVLVVRVVVAGPDDVSRITVVLSLPRKRAKRTSNTRTATARMPSNPPGKEVVSVVVVVAPVVRVSLVTEVPVDGAAV